MKPKPLVSLNHFTFPVIRILCSLFLGSLGMRADPTLGSEARRILAIAVLAVKCSMISALTLVVDVLRRIAASDSTRSPYRKEETFHERSEDVRCRHPGHRDRRRDARLHPGPAGL